MNTPEKFPCFSELFVCGDKVFNLIVETYATQTFPELSFFRVCTETLRSKAQIIKRIKSKQKTSPRDELAN